MEKKFGERVRELRHARSMTLEDVAKKAKIQKGYLSGIEKGRVNPPSPRVVRGIAKALGENPKDLLMLATVQKAPEEIKDDLKRAVCPREKPKEEPWTSASK